MIKEGTPVNVSLVLAVASNSPSGVKLEGTCFPVAKSLLATTAHVASASDSLVVVLPRGILERDYQDTAPGEVRMLKAVVIAIDPIRDLALLRVDTEIQPHFTLASTDAVAVGESLNVLGYPHADHGRLILTQHTAQIGARILLDPGGVKTKHVVLNIQTRPGQSGAPAMVPGTQQVAAVVVGAYRPPSGGGGIIIAGIDPLTLHQTSHAVSAEYLEEMVSDANAG